MKNILKCLIGATLLIGFCENTAHGQQTMTITGTVDKSLLTEKNFVNIKVYHEELLALRNAENEQYEVSPNNDGSFYIEIPSKKENFYIDIAYEKEKGAVRLFSRNRLLLVKPSQILKIDIKPKGISFPNDNLSVIHYQDEVNRLEMSLPPAWKIDYALLLNYKLGLDSILNRQKEISTKYYNLIDSGIRERVDANFLFSNISGILSSILLFSKNNEEQRIASYRFYEKLSIDLSESLKPLNGYANVLNYIECMYNKEILDLACKQNKSVRDISGIELYRNLKNGYSGLIKDKLLSLWFIKQSKVQGSSIPFDLADNVLSEIQSSKYKTLVLDILGAKSAGSPAFDFDLLDAYGNHVKLADFRGKILVIEFWFSGCKPCMLQSEYMEPVADKYSADEDLVFITISADRNIDAWKKSLKSGEYTTKESIDLYTNGKGINHPILKHYDYFAFPQVLIIDNNGLVITSNPPLPDGGVRTEAFLSILEKAKEKKTEI